MLRMDQTYVIRHKVLVENISVRRVARELGVSRNRVRRYVEGATPGVRVAVARASPVKERVWPRPRAVARGGAALDRRQAAADGGAAAPAARRRELRRQRPRRPRDGRGVEAPARGG